jgi:hypothetical protein
MKILMSSNFLYAIFYVKHFFHCFSGSGSIANNSRAKLLLLSLGQNKLALEIICAILIQIGSRSVERLFFQRDPCTKKLGTWLN